MPAYTKDQAEIVVPSPGWDSQDRLRATLRTPWANWVRPLVEMVLVMMIGMTMLAVPVTAVADTLGYRDLAAHLPAVATLMMAFEMTVPMAIWMGYRGHRGRGIIEMSAAMIVPAIVLVVAAGVGLTGTSGMRTTYHVAMLAATVGLMLYRRAEYSGGISHG